MLDRLTRRVLLQNLVLVWLGFTCEATSLGLTVHVEPLESDGGNTVRAHFTAIASNPCPSLSGVCADGEDCVTHLTSLPFNGTKPDSGWCVRQWQKTVPSNYTDTISLGSNTELFVSMKTGPHIRSNSGKPNKPAFVALPPPLRARENCPHHFPLQVRDMDGDRVSCRFAIAEQGECLDCAPHDFIELHEDNCMLTFTGNAAAGQYFIYLMAEDRIPVPRISHVAHNEPLSSVPVHLSLTVEAATAPCSAEPVATGDTPEEDSMHFVLPYQEIKFDLSYTSTESVVEIAVVGPPELFRVDFQSVDSASSMSLAWVRAENNLPRLLPICFAANSLSLQSEYRCVWLYQREMKALPAGTELTCEDTQMTLVLPVSSLTDINLAELQLNSPACPVSYNDTYLTASISLDGCGTKAVQAGSELVYTNTLKSVRPYTMVSRKPSLILPLACRIPGIQVKGPQFQVNLPSEVETFGNIAITLEFYFPGEGPLSRFTRDPVLRSLQRVRRQLNNSPLSVNSKAIGDKISTLDLHVMSNTSVERAEMIVSNCLESETEDFAVSYPILEQGCSSSGGVQEIVTNDTASKVYRMDMASLQSTGTTMYVQCTVNLCISTLPSQKCPDLCTRGLKSNTLLNNLYTKTYTIKSGAVSLVITTPAPAVTATATQAATAQAATTSHAPEKAPVMAVGVLLTTIVIFLQHISF